MRRRDRRRRTPRLPSGKPGVGAESYAYDELMKALRPSVDDELRHVVVDANRRGIPLLRYEDACGPEYPLWILLPAQNIICPMQSSFQITHVM